MSVGGDTLKGAASGAALGASVGSAVPVIGTAIGGVVGAVGGAAVGLISGEAKKKKRDAAAKAAKQRPTYEIPQEVFQNKAMYEAMANSSRVPGQAYIENQIGQSEARALRASQNAAGSSADALAAVGGIQQNTQEQYGNLAAMGAQFQMQNKDKFAQSRENVADYRQQAFDYNINQPYQIAFAQNQKLQDQSKLDDQNAVNDTMALSSTIGSMGKSSKKKKSDYSPYQSTSGMDYTYQKGDPNPLYTKFY